MDNKVDWTEVRIDAAISAMQGLMENGKVSLVLDLAPEVLAERSVVIADALVDELKKGRKDRKNEKEE